MCLYFNRTEIEFPVPRRSKISIENVISKDWTLDMARDLKLFSFHRGRIRSPLNVYPVHFDGLEKTLYTIT